MASTWSTRYLSLKSTPARRRVTPPHTHNYKTDTVFSYSFFQDPRICVFHLQRILNQPYLTLYFLILIMFTKRRGGDERGGYPDSSWGVKVEGKIEFEGKKTIPFWNFLRRQEVHAETSEFWVINSTLKSPNRFRHPGWDMGMDWMSWS